MPSAPGGSTIGNRRDHLRAVARVPAQCLSDDAGVVLALLDPDDVRARCIDDVDHLLERLGTPSRPKAPLPGVEVELVAAIEDVQVQDANDGRVRRGRPGRDRRPPGERNERHERERGEQAPGLHRGLHGQSTAGSVIVGPRGGVVVRDDTGAVVTRFNRMARA